ncbi:MAG TPA: RHS repeat-associated core domain-containing protein [Acidobacteriota bacterium]|nr:RHS repeat-associated core domain-containing protein [Acidobacteriota bacterium]
MSTPNYHSSSLMIDPSTNRILDAGYEYDAAGYMLRDPQRSYRWDAAGRLIAVAPSDQTPLDDGRCTGAGCPPPPDPPSGPGGPLDNGRSLRGRGAAGGSAQSVSYEYDYTGRRVIKRHEDGSGRIYFWDEVMGEVLWEFPLGGSQQDLVRGYFNGQLVVENDARGPGIHFFHRDHLGCTLMSTNFLSPTVVCDSFFHPFGQSADTTACDSHVRKFTGKERDPESSLDYFGARYYDKVAGRFLARDPLLASADLADPQTWNRYIYVRNRPMVFVDPDGRDPISAEECESNSNCIRLQLNVILDQDADIFDDDGNLRPRFQQLLDEQIAQARDELGAVGIYLDVIYSRGGVEGRRITSGTVDKALNYALSDSNNTEHSWRRLARLIISGR